MTWRNLNRILRLSSHCASSFSQELPLKETVLMNLSQRGKGKNKADPVSWVLQFLVAIWPDSLLDLQSTLTHCHSFRQVFPVFVCFIFAFVCLLKWFAVVSIIGYPHKAKLLFQESEQLRNLLLDLGVPRRIHKQWLRVVTGFVGFYFGFDARKGKKRKGEGKKRGRKKITQCSRHQGEGQLLHPNRKEALCEGRKKMEMEMKIK